MGPLISVSLAPIKLCDNGLVSSSSDGDGDGDSAKQKTLLRVVVVVSCLSRSDMRDRWELDFCYDFNITLSSYITVVQSTFVLYKTQGIFDKVKLQFEL